MVSSHALQLASSCSAFKTEYRSHHPWEVALAPSLSASLPLLLSLLFPQYLVHLIPHSTVTYFHATGMWGVVWPGVQNSRVRLPWCSPSSATGYLSLLGQVLSMTLKSEFSYLPVEVKIDLFEGLLGGPTVIKYMKHLAQVLGVGKQ